MSAANKITGRTASAAVWLIASRFGMRAIDLVSLLILARILTPKDFGIVAVAMTLIQIVEAIFELPVGQVLIRSREISRPLLNTAFTLGALRGLVLTALLAAIALPFSIIFADGRLFSLICFLSLAPAARGLMSPKMALFAQALDFRRDVAIELGGKVAAMLAAAALALITHSYWAIAAGTVLTPVVMVAISYVFAPFAPAVSLAEWRTFSHFLGWTTASQAVTAINWQLDRLMLGRFTTHENLGVFSMASDLSGLPEQAIVKPITRPLLSAFSLIRDDLGRLGEAYNKSATGILTAGLPVMVGISLLAEPAVHLGLGPRWHAVPPYLQWLALTLIPPLFTSPLGALAISLGRTHIFLRQSLIELCIKVPSVLLGLWWFGIWGVIGARALTATAMGLVSAWLVKGMIGLPIVQQLLRPWRALLAGALLAAILFILRPYLHDLQGLALGVGLALCAAAGLAVYLGALSLLWWVAGRPSGVEASAFYAIRSVVASRLGRRR